MLLFLIAGFVIVVFGAIAFRGAPYVPTHRNARGVIISHAQPTGTIVDLGSGDGTVLVVAAKSGRRIVGVELNPILVAMSYIRLRRYKHLASVVLGDFWRYKLPDDTSTVFVFLAGPFMIKLDKYIKAEARRLNHPIRLISYGFEVPNRPPVLRDGPVIVYDISA